MMRTTNTRSLSTPGSTSLATLLVVGLALTAGAAAENPATATNRPLRTERELVLTVGQDEGDLRGTDDTIIQAGIEYLNRLGGGTLRLGPGVYVLHNSVHLRANVTLQGAGEMTVLRKAPSVVTPLVRDSDWFEYGIQVEDPTGFEPGGGIMLRVSTGPGDWQYDVLRATVTEVRRDVIYLDRTTGKNFWTEKSATAATIFPLLTAEGVDHVTVTGLVLDGNRAQNEHINGNYSGAVFIQDCNRWHFENVVARDYNGDGFSFQVCDDITFVNCQAMNNADLGFHPGSGAQRPVFRNCVARGNQQGIFFCWSVSDGRVEDCTLSENRNYGISIGHRDTDNIIVGCTIERNGQVGILFRKEGSEFRGGHRNRIERCTLRDNGTDANGIAIDIQGPTHDVMVSANHFENTADAPQRVAIRIGRETQGIELEDNTFENWTTTIQDRRSAAVPTR